MAFQVSPGVNVSEIDYSTTIVPLSTSTGAIAGFFNWGPVSEVIQVTSENELHATFGKPARTQSNTSDVFFTAASFLAYSSDLRVVRTSAATAYNAVANNSVEDDVSILNDTQFVEGSSTHTEANTAVWIAAKYPGSLGNSLKVAYLANTDPAGFDGWAYKSLFNKAPGTSAWVKRRLNNSVANDEIHLVVIDEDGDFSGTRGTVLEKWSGSVATNAKNVSTGESIYYKDLINRSSKYIRVLGGFPADLPASNNWNTAVGASTICLSAPYTTNAASFINGSSGLDNSDAKIRDGYDKFANSEDIDVQLIMTAGHSANVCQYVVQNIAESRADCLVFLSPAQANVLSSVTNRATSVINYRNNVLGNLSSSYAVMDSGWKYIYDKYNDIYQWAPLNGDIAGLCARTDQTRDPWFSPAGVQRGQIKNIVRLAWNPNKAERDTLYKNDVNPVVSFTGEGTMLYGDKTLLGYDSAFDRINVRRLFIVLEKAISRAARASLFEFNDEFTRSQFVNLVEPFLRSVQGRRGIYDFRVVCDASNNTADVVDRNEFVGDIYIKPAKAINYIQLNFIAVRGGVAFEEIVGKF